MKNAIALAAIAGIASAAAAQSGSLTIVPSASTIDSTMQTSFTLSVYADADLGANVLGVSFNLDAVGGAGIVNSMTAASPAWGATFQTGNDNGDGNYFNYGMGQLPFGVPAAESALGGAPVLVGTFTVDIAAMSAGQVDWSVAFLSGYTLQTYTGFTFYDDGAPDPAGGVYGGLAVSLGSASVNIVPAPSAMALLGLGGLVAGRRRR